MKSHTLILFFTFLFSIQTTPADAAGLPDGISRFNPAGLAESWAFEGSAFVGFRAASDRTVPVFRLKHPKRGYALTARDDEKRLLEAAGFITEGIAFHALKDGLDIYQFVDNQGRFFYGPQSPPANSGQWTREGIAFHAGGGDIQIWRYRSVTSGGFLFTGAHESPYRVGAYYFGSFSPSAKALVAGTKRIHGRPDWWGGVADFYGRQPGVSQDRRGWEGNFDYLKPAIGYYNQADPKTLEQHIRQATDAGLAFFSFYWYWDNKNGTELLPEALRSFLAARNSHEFKFNLALYAHPWDDDMAIDAANDERSLRRLVSYFSDPRYLRLPDGRPVFVIGDTRNIRDQDGYKCSDSPCIVRSTEQFIRKLKKMALELNGIAPFIQLQPSPGWDSIMTADGTSCLVPPMTVKGGTPYPHFSESIYATLTRQGKSVSPCMLQNFDERPRQDIAIENRNGIRYLVGKTDSLFRDNLRAVRRFSDAAFERSRDPASRIIYLYAWNEWHEGGILEPNVATGAHDLNIVTDVFQLPRLASECLDKGLCLVP